MSAPDKSIDNNAQLAIDIVEHMEINPQIAAEGVHKLIHELTLDIRQINEELLISAVRQHTDNEVLAKEAVRNRAIAEAMQYSILWPQPEKRFRGLTVASFYEPATSEALVGGDFFDAFKLANKSIMLLVGDVTGKGLKAAARTVEVIFAARAFAQDYMSPAATLSRLNKFICEFHNGEDESIGNALIVMCIIVIDPSTGGAQIASAGAEPPLILRASGATEEIPTRGLILGIDSGFVYESMDLRLDFGDTLLMFTDGITEARFGRDFFGYERLLETARAAAETGTLHDIGKTIMDAAHAYTSGRLNDDACLLVAQRA